MVATAAVTLAIGVTVAALGGYLVPTGEGKTRSEAVLPIAGEPRPAAQPGGPSVVLVPVAPDARAQPPATVSTAPELRFATYEPEDDADGDDHHRGRSHREREHHHDDD